METDKSKRPGSEKGGEPKGGAPAAAKRRKKSKAFEKFEATAEEPGTTVLAVKQEHPEFSRSSSEGEEAASRDGNQQAAASRLEAERRARAELQACLKEAEQTLTPRAAPLVVPPRIQTPSFAPSANLGQNAALLALPMRRAEGERKARMELQAKLQAESKALVEERAKVEKAKAEALAKAKAVKEAKESLTQSLKEHKEAQNKEAQNKEAKNKAKSKAEAAKVVKAAKTEAKAPDPKVEKKLTAKVASGARRAAPAPSSGQAGTEDGPLVPVKQEHGRSRSSSEKGKKPTKASAAKAKAGPPAAGHVAQVKPKVAAGADAMLLVEIVFKDKIRKVKHKASTKISELFSEYEPKIRAAHKDLGALRVCDDKGVEQGSELTLSALRDGSSANERTVGSSSESVRLVFEEDDWLS